MLKFVYFALAGSELNFCFWKACGKKDPGLVIRGPWQSREKNTFPGEFFPLLLVIGLTKAGSALWTCLWLPFADIKSPKKFSSDLSLYFGWHESYPWPFWPLWFKCLAITVIALSLLLTQLIKTADVWGGKHLFIKMLCFHGQGMSNMCSNKCCTILVPLELLIQDIQFYTLPCVLFNFP